MYSRKSKDWISFFSYLIFLSSPPAAQEPLRPWCCMFSLGTVHSPAQVLSEDAKAGAEGALGSTDWLRMSLGQERPRRTVLTWWGLHCCEANVKQQSGAHLSVPDSSDVMQQHQRCREMRSPRGWQNRWSLNLYWRLRLHSFCILNNLYDLIIWELQLWKQMMLKQDLIQSVHLPVFKNWERWGGHPAAHSPSRHGTFSPKHLFITVYCI